MSEYVASSIWVLPKIKFNNFRIILESFFHEKTHLNQKNNPLCPGLELFQIGTASSISRKVI